MPFSSPLPVLLSSFVIGLATAYFAYRRHKNLYFWFSMGFLFGVLALIFLFFSPYLVKNFKKRQEKKILSKPLTDMDIFFMSSFHKEKLWFYLDQKHQQNGPVSFDWMRKKYIEGKISASTYVWNDSFKKWKKIEEFLSFQKQDNKKLTTS